MVGDRSLQSLKVQPCLVRGRHRRHSTFRLIACHTADANEPNVWEKKTTQNRKREQGVSQCPNPPVQITKAPGHSHKLYTLHHETQSRHPNAEQAQAVTFNQKERADTKHSYAPKSEPVPLRPMDKTLQYPWSGTKH